MRPESTLYGFVPGSVTEVASSRPGVTAWPAMVTRCARRVCSAAMVWLAALGSVDPPVSLVLGSQPVPRFTGRPWRRSPTAIAPDDCGSHLPVPSTLVPA